MKTAVSSRPNLGSIQQLLNQREAQGFSPYATLSAGALRRREEKRLDTGYRQSFSVDVDRILHSLAYVRYVDKTQVFYLVENDHITHRALHVQLVSKIARTIGRFMGLNEDLIEAIALGHDIGHAPFGHDGERFLSQLCRQRDIGFFHHNLQSVEFLERVEKKGRGLNLCLQTLDGIMCHDGEVHDRQLTPQKDKTFAQLEREFDAKKTHQTLDLLPMSMEGCVMRMADTISYIGRDLEDAIRLGLVQRSELPADCARVLGRTNGTIVYNLVTDVIRNSYDRPYVSFSRPVSDALKTLKHFNYERIYLSPVIKRHTATIGHLFEVLFERYMRDLETGDVRAPIFRRFLENMSTSYISGRQPAEIVRDFIAGMTDRYFLRQCGTDAAGLLHED